MFVVDNLNDLRILAIFFLVFDDFFDGDLGREDDGEASWELECNSCGLVDSSSSE